MPKRSSCRVIKTPDLQGDDSFVLVSMLTLGESDEWDVARAGWQKLAKKGDEESRRKASEASKRYTCETLARHVLDWNWVDDAGAPLAKPKGDPAVFDRLTAEELDFVTQAVIGRTEAERKNSASASASPSSPAEATHPASTPGSSSAASTAAAPAS